jgi:hypothetical protein
MQREGPGGVIAQPEEGRHRGWFADVLRQSAGGLEVCILDHIGRIDPSLEAAVHAQRHHPPQPLTVLRQHRAPSRVTTPRVRLEPPGALAVVIPSRRLGCSHNTLDRTRAAFRDKPLPFFFALPVELTCLSDGIEATGRYPR